MSTILLPSPPRVSIVNWAQEVRQRASDFVAALSTPGKPGLYRFCPGGLTRLGKRLVLGPSCFAAKTLFTLNAWPSLAQDDRQQWLARLRSFQVDGWEARDPLERASFVDPALRQALVGWPTVCKRWLRWPRRKPRQLWREARLAETKQAIVTLHQLGAAPRVAFPTDDATRHRLLEHLDSLDWSRPWSAGGQASAVTTLLVLRARSSRHEDDIAAVYRCRRLFDQLADRTTGGYFRGPCPEHGQLVNGAMKVLTALDWLDQPIHYSQQLIDTCLALPPQSSGCHLVDAVYVVYRCWCQTSHRRGDIATYARHAIQSVVRHLCADGGFAFYPNRAQTTYYGVRVSHGLPVGDLHGTCLLTWALAMLFRLMDLAESPRWEVIVP